MEARYAELHPITLTEAMIRFPDLTPVEVCDKMESVNIERGYYRIDLMVAMDTLKTKLKHMRACALVELDYNELFK